MGPMGTKVYICEISELSNAIIEGVLDLVRVFPKIVEFVLDFYYLKGIYMTNSRFISQAVGVFYNTYNTWIYSMYVRNAI